ncbi:MAG: hypothetical protein ABIG63_07405 [Chloroflexota bacterium]
MRTKKLSLIIAISVLLLVSFACGILSPSESSEPAEKPTEVPAIAEPTTAPLAEANPTEENSTPLESAEDITSSEVLITPPPADSGACANVLYPLIPGYQWVYEVVSPEETSQIGLTVTEVNGNQATINTLHLDTGITTETKVDCDEGAILNFPIIMLGFLVGDADGAFQVEYMDGVFVPSYQTLEDQNWELIWTGEYIASGTIEAEADGDHITGSLQDSPMTMEWQVPVEGQDIFDAIEVQAGNFPEAIKIERKLTLDFTAELEEDGVKETLSAVLVLYTHLWFEPNMGLLKQKVERASIEIYGISFPVVMESTIELMKFRVDGG